MGTVEDSEETYRRIARAKRAEFVTPQESGLAGIAGSAGIAGIAGCPQTATHEWVQ
jgi:hypothetical protein